MDERSSNRLHILTQTARAAVASRVHVVCCTCSVAGTSYLRTYRFELCLIDEATQSIEPENLIAITSGARQVVFVGDHRQWNTCVCELV